MVAMLLDSGADTNVNLKDSAGDSALIYAAYGTGEGIQSDTFSLTSLLQRKNGSCV